MRVRDTETDPRVLYRALRTPQFWDKPWTENRRQAYHMSTASDAWRCAKAQAADGEGPASRGRARLRIRLAR